MLRNLPYIGFAQYWGSIGGSLPIHSKEYLGFSHWIDQKCRQGCAHYGLYALFE